MSHSHDHDLAHAHATSERALRIAVLLTGVFMLAEVAGGLVSGSLALLADAGHMLTDFATLSMALLALLIARRPADWKRTYGFDRFSVLVAFVNGLSLFAIAIWITLEAMHRFRQPFEVLGGVMLWVAVAGLAVNIPAFRVLTRGDRRNLNMRAAILHVGGDLLGSLAALAAALVIIYTGWMPIDPILSVVVAGIILRSAWALVRDSGRILLEAAPPGLDRREIARTLTERVEGVTRVGHVHAWSITPERPMLTLEAEVAPGHDPVAVRAAIGHLLRDRFKVDHATVELRPARP